MAKTVSKSKTPKKFQSLKPTKKVARNNITVSKTNSKTKKEKEPSDYSPEEWLQKEAKRIEQEFKKYAPDLKPDSGRSAEHCAVTAMTLAHHGTKEAIEALKKFKKDKRVPGWIDCAIEECEMILWDDTVGRQLDQAEKELKKAAEEVFNQGLVWDKRIITDALKAILAEQKTKFTYGETAKLYYEKKVIAEEKTEFIINDVLLVSIKPNFADWLIRFKQGIEGKDLRQGDLENIEQGMIYNDEGKELDEPRSLEESFDDFYSRQFQCLLQMSKKEQGILLDFSGEKLYGQYFTPRRDESGLHRDVCSGCCEACLEELKCPQAQEFKIDEDKKRYRILKQLLKEIVEIEGKIESTKRPSNDLEYKIQVVKKLKDDIQERIKQEKSQDKRKELQENLTGWDCEIFALQAILDFEQPKPEERKRLKTLKEMYQAIKQEVETKEYKNDVEGLEVYYGKAEPSSEEAAACYHDPLCECDEYEPLTAEEATYKHEYDNKEIDVDEMPDVALDEVPF
ncbi:hypothetical protein KKD19_03835 [Patescibacteria group bacterium]|nr:hypothetical protein [Patescibacteria group bacterium]MBU4512340.1 hypothetical protein [Patescibacteria group bacterium]